MRFAFSGSKRTPSSASSRPQSARNPVYGKDVLPTRGRDQTPRAAAYASSSLVQTPRTTGTPATPSSTAAAAAGATPRTTAASSASRTTAAASRTTSSIASAGAAITPRAVAPAGTPRSSTSATQSQPAPSKSTSATALGTPSKGPIKVFDSEDSKGQSQIMVLPSDTLSPLASCTITTSDGVYQSVKHIVETWRFSMTPGVATIIKAKKSADQIQAAVEHYRARAATWSESEWQSYVREAFMLRSSLDKGWVKSLMATKDKHILCNWEGCPFPNLVGRVLMQIRADQLAVKSSPIRVAAQEGEREQEPVAGTPAVGASTAHTPRIEFCDWRGASGFLCNSYPSAMKDKYGGTYASVEHYFQAHKFEDSKLFNHIVSAPSPDDAFNRARACSEFVRGDWLSIRQDVMRKGLWLKFSNSDLAAQLAATSPAELVHAPTDDAFWGAGATNRGQNVLGRLLMELRSELLGLPASTSQQLASQPASSARPTYRGGSVPPDIGRRAHGAGGAAAGAILFYNRGEPYYEFTNFFPASIVVDGATYPTSEHFFQAQKFAPHRMDIADYIRQLPAPRDAFDASRNYTGAVRPDWADVKEDVMMVGLRAKFTQHVQLRRMLLDTGDQQLVEHTSNDTYWGDGGDGSGKNRLGELLMKLRGELRGGSTLPGTGVGGGAVGSATVTTPADIDPSSTQSAPASFQSSKHTSRGGSVPPGIGRRAQGGAAAGAILFYNRGEPYYEFTNFFPASIVVDGATYPTSEHFFQAQKFAPHRMDIADYIRQLPAPRDAFDASRNYTGAVRPDWADVKEDVMMVGLRAKFTQHVQLRRMLLDTGDQQLVEHTSNDTYWGDGGDGSGKNRLGELLMKLRGELRGGSTLPGTGVGGGAVGSATVTTPADIDPSSTQSAPASFHSSKHTSRGGSVPPDIGRRAHGASGAAAGAILFYNRGEPYYEFTNFFPASIVVDGATYPTSEHFFQAQKFAPHRMDIADYIRQLPAPRDAFDASRNYTGAVRPDWADVKEDVMMVGLRAKFTQHVQLRRMLLDTGDQQLVEHTSNDTYWGDGGDGSGKNRLGELLMKLRGELRGGTGDAAVTAPASSAAQLAIESAGRALLSRRSQGAAIGSPAVILFHRADQPYFEFTNFYPASIVVDALVYPTSEHYFQACKFDSYPNLMQQVRRCETPKQASELAHDYQAYVRRDWRSVNTAVMKKALSAKFSQHPNLAALLLGTGSSILVAHTDKDAFWGDAGDGSGQNMLGVLLMQVRDELNANPAPTPAARLATTKSHVGSSSPALATSSAARRSGSLPPSSRTYGRG